MAFIVEKEKTLPVNGAYDIVIIGGGIGGVAAGVSAARMGKKCLIVEKQAFLGGLATSGHICLYLPLCDGRGRKVVGGVAEELLHVSIRYGYDTLPPEWRSGSDRVQTPCGRYSSFFNIPACVLAFEELLENEGVEILYDTVFCRPVMENGQIDAVILENKSGRFAIRCGGVIDASGDADVMSRAGADCVDAKNLVSYVCYDTDLQKMQKAIDTGRVGAAVNWRMIGCFPDTDPETIERWGTYYGSTGDDVNKLLRKSHKAALDFLKKHQTPDYTMLSVPGMAQVRTTRRIRGLYELQPEDVHKHFDDSIGCTGDWRKAGPVFEIPYRSLIDGTVKNAIAAGRIIGSAGDAWEVTRVIPPVAMTGQAAGTAMSMALDAGSDVQSVDIRQLQAALEKTGVLIHE